MVVSEVLFIEGCLVRMIRFEWFRLFILLLRLISFEEIFESLSFWLKVVLVVFSVLLMVVRKFWKLCLVMFCLFSL